MAALIDRLCCSELNRVTLILAIYYLLSVLVKIQIKY